MGAYRLNTYVHAVERPGAGSEGRSAMFGPGDTLPDWALAAISNPDVWAGDAPPRPADPESVADPAAGDEVALLRARVAELEAAAASTSSADGGADPQSDTVVPPRGGPGSGALEWREYARTVGVEVADDASRDDVIAALEAAGKPTK